MEAAVIVSNVKAMVGYSGIVGMVTSIMVIWTAACCDGNMIGLQSTAAVWSCAGPLIQSLASLS